MIVEIKGDEKIKESRKVINENFKELNERLEKIEKIVKKIINPQCLK